MEPQSRVVPAEGMEKLAADAAVARAGDGYTQTPLLA
jgi:hypothetical protein